MKKLLAFASVLMLFLCCFSIAAVADSRRDAPVSVSLDFPAEQIIVHDPEESLGYDAADEYCLAHSSEVTIRFSLPAAADPARSFVQIAYDFYEPHYFTDMPTENGCYVFTSSIDTTDTTGYPFSDLQIYINQDYAPYEQWPNHLVNIFAAEANLNEWCSYFDGVSWEYPEDTPENPTDVPEDPTDAPEDPTDAPEDPTDAPEDPTDVPENPTDVPDNRTRCSDRCSLPVRSVNRNRCNHRIRHRFNRLRCGNGSLRQTPNKGLIVPARLLFHGLEVFSPSSSFLPF